MTELAPIATGSAERVDRQTAPLVVGQYYLVPTVRLAWCGKMKNWPVIGPKHSDADRFAFKHEHYHVDGRFLSDAALRHKDPFAQPLAAPPRWVSINNDIPAPEYRRLKCRRAVMDYPYGHRNEIVQIQRDFAGSQCATGKGGWICPHRKTSLGSVAAINGVITCPLHGLRINATTGVVLPAEQQQ